MLRGLVDWAGNPGPDISLADAVCRRADWLVCGPVTVNVEPGATAAGGTAAVIPAIVELAFFLLAGDGTPTAATVSVRLTGRGAQIQLELTGSAPRCGGGPRFTAFTAGTGAACCGAGRRGAYPHLGGRAAGMDHPAHRLGTPVHCP